MWVASAGVPRRGRLFLSSRIESEGAGFKSLKWPKAEAFVVDRAFYRFDEILHFWRVWNSVVLKLLYASSGQGFMIGNILTNWGVKQM